MAARMAVLEDAEKLLAVYAQYIDTPVTFECALPAKEEFVERIRTISREYPYLVWEEKGNIVGYAYAHRQMERQAYQWNAELSVYLDQSYTEQGIGKRLYRLLIEILKLQGIRTVYGGVTLPNPRSEGLHRSLGFRLLGMYRHTGYKCGKWHDVGWFEKTIADYDTSPSPFIPISNIPKERLEQIIKY